MSAVTNLLEQKFGHGDTSIADATDTTTDTGVFTELVEHFDEEVPCAAKGHDHAAEWHARTSCVHCGYHQSMMLCEERRQAWEAKLRRADNLMGVKCSGCGRITSAITVRQMTSWVKI